MGKNVKWKYEPYAFYNKDGIEGRLQEMAAQGWFIEKMGRLWKYRKGKPAKRTYNVVYMQEPGHDGVGIKQLELAEYCEAAGWKRCFAKKGMRIFYHDGASPVPIETNPEFTLQSIHKSMKEVYFQQYLTFFILAVTYIIQIYNAWDARPLETMASNFSLFLIAYILMAVIALFDEVLYFRWRSKTKKALEDGEEIISVKESKVKRFLADWSVFGVVLVAIIIFAEENAYTWVLFTVGVFIIFYFISRAEDKNRNTWFEDKPQEEEVSKKELKQPWAFLMIFGIGIAAAVLFGLLADNGIGVSKQSDIECAAITYEDFFVLEENQTIDSSYDVSESILLKKENFTQYIERWKDEDFLYIKEFEYDYIQIKINRIYDLALEKLLYQNDIELNDFIEKDGKMYGAKQLYVKEDMCIVLWKDAILWIDFGNKVDEDDMKYAIEKMRW